MSLHSIFEKKMARIPRRQRRLALSTLLLISLFIALAVFASFAHAQDGDAEEVGYTSDEVDGEEQEATFEDAGGNEKRCE